MIIAKEDNRSIARKIFLIRKFEERLLDLFHKGEISGTTHTCIGQEANPVALSQYLSKEDCVFGSHRSHGYFLAHAGEPFELFSEILGKRSGVCGGRGGSQHLCKGNFFTNGIQGGIVGNAIGTAFAGHVTVALLGDGTMGEGLVYESMNIAASKGLPVLFVLEDNGLAQSTESKTVHAGNFQKRAEGFGVETDHIKSNNVFTLMPFFEKAVDFVRTERRPYFVVIETYRLSAHSKGDDFRDPKELCKAKEFDPISLLKEEFSTSDLEEIEEEARIIIEDDLARAKGQADSNYIAQHRESIIPRDFEDFVCSDETYGKQIYEALKHCLTKDPSIFLIGEDICAPYGGAFKITDDLSEIEPDRVMNTPISEGAIVALGVGAAMAGLRPIVEIMFGDFITLAVDQLVNHAAKYAYLYNDQVSVPLVVRTPMGGRRGYGATHSQSIEKIILGIPGLCVVCPSLFHNVGGLLCKAALHSRDPVVFVEQKNLYSKKRPTSLMWHRKTLKNHDYETLVFTCHIEKPHVSIISYGASVSLALQAAEKLALQEEIFCSVLAPSQLYPVPIKDLSVCDGLLVTIEEGNISFGWGGEILTALSEREGYFPKDILRIGAPETPIPSSKKMEKEMMFDSETIYNEILNKVRGLVL